MRKLDLFDLDINIYASDFNYYYKINNYKSEKRYQRIIIFGLKEKFKYLDCKNNSEIFIDSTFKIIPAHFRPHKLLVIAGLPINEKSQH